MWVGAFLAETAGYLFQRIARNRHKPAGNATIIIGPNGQSIGKHAIRNDRLVDQKRQLRMQLQKRAGLNFPCSRLVDWPQRSRRRAKGFEQGPRLLELPGFKPPSAPIPPPLTPTHPPSPP